jgi:O-antigen ligase
MNPLSIAAWAAALFLAATLFSHSVALRLLMLLLGLALVVVELVRAKVARRDPGVRALPPLLVPVLLWSAWAGLSVLWSQEPERSQKEFQNEVVYVFLGYWLSYVAMQAQGARRVIGIVLGTAGVLACLVGIYVYFAPSAQPWIARLASGPGDQSSAMLTLMPCALLAIWLARIEAAPRTLQLALWTLPPLILVAAYVTLNRIVWVGFAIELGVVAALLMSRQEFDALRRSRRSKLVSGLLAAALVGGVALVMVQIEEKRVDLNPVTDIGVDPRLAIWASAVGTIRQNPVTGLGFGRGIDRKTVRKELGNPQIWHSQYWHAHNLILEAAVGSGVPGAALLLLLIGFTAYKGWRLAQDKNAEAAAYGIALVAVVAGMFVRNLTDAQLARQNALLYWGLAGALLAFGTARSASKLNSTLPGDLRQPTR